MSFAAEGAEQQSRTCPFSNAATGSSKYSTLPCFRMVAHVPQMPERQPNTGAIPRFSANSRSVPCAGVHSALIPDLGSPHDPYKTAR